MINGRKPIGNTVILGGGRIDPIPENRPYEMDNIRIAGRGAKAFTRRPASKTGNKGPQSITKALAEFRF